MGKSIITLFSEKLDIRSRSSSKNITKLKTLLGLAIARIAILKNQHQARCSLAHSDIAQLLALAQFDRAVRRAEIVVREEDLLDVFVIVQSHCHLIIERPLLLCREKDCPNELKEAVSSLIYVSSRSAEMPELQHVRSLFSAIFGSEFVRAAIELHSSCSVNPKIVQKLSTKKPTLESRVRIVKEIGAEKGITLNIEDSKSLKVNPNSTKNNNTSQKEETVLGSDKHKETNSDSTDISFKENKPNKFVSWGSTENNEKNAQSESETEKQSKEFLNPWYQNTRNCLRESFKGLFHEEGDTLGLLDSTDDEDILKSYYSETTSPGIETVRIDFTKKSPIQDSKVTRKMAVSVRTRR